MNKIKKIFLIYILLLSRITIADNLKDLDWILIQEFCLDFVVKNKKILINKGLAYLKPYGIFLVNQNNKIVIDQKLIHRILGFKKDTLSINVVFGQIEKKNSKYKLFVKQDQITEEDINSRIEIKNTYKKHKILNNIIKILYVK